MARVRLSSTLLLLVFVLLMLLLAGAGIQHRLSSPLPTIVESAEQYQRAVYILQGMGGPAALEHEIIPGRVAFSDATESLLHHPDKIFILDTVANMLAEVRHEYPKATLFEAYARLSMGERRVAVDLLSCYVVEYEYNPLHYSLLCANLYDMRDYTSLYIICREWRERDPSCREDLDRYTWLSLYYLERYAQARDYALKVQSCLRWQSGVYAAKAARALNNDDDVERLLDETIRLYPQDAALIRRMWEHIQDKSLL